MSAGQWVILLVVVLIVVGVVWVMSQRRRSGQLREQFGPEYDRLVEDRDGDKKTVEAELAERSRRRGGFDIKELSAADRDRYAESWRRAQLRFLDEPETAIVEADRLVMEVMRGRGYPVEDFEQRAADLSVDHPVVVQNYRAGHEITGRHRTGQASTEDLRQGMIHYRALFVELLGLEATDRPDVATDGTGTMGAAAATDAADADRDAADRDAADRDAAARAADREAADREAAAADRETADRDAVARDAADREAAEREGAAEADRHRSSPATDRDATTKRTEVS
jgi:hypothetical protein